MSTGATERVTRYGGPAVPAGCLRPEGPGGGPPLPGSWCTVSSCEQQLDMGQSILKDCGVPHTQALPRILKGSVYIFPKGRGKRTVA